MPLAVMLASFLTLPLSLPVSVLFFPSLSGFAAWRWLLSLALFPPGVLVITLVDLSSLCEDRRSLYAFAPERSARFCLNAGPQRLGSLALFSFLVCRSASFFPLASLSLYRATSIERHLFFVIQNSF